MRKCPLWLIFSTLDDNKFQMHLVPVTLLNGPSSLLQLALPLVWLVLSVETCLFIWSLQLWSNCPSICRFYTVLCSLNHVCVLMHHGCVYTMCVCTLYRHQVAVLFHVGTALDSVPAVSFILKWNLKLSSFFAALISSGEEMTISVGQHIPS